jgi:hypothetical protein
MSRTLAVVVVVVMWLAGPALAETFTGVFSATTDDGQNTLELTQTGSRISGTFTVGTTRLVITGTAAGSKVVGTASLEGTPVTFSVVLRIDGAHLVAEVTEHDEAGNLDPKTTENIVFDRKRGARPPAPAAPPAAPASLDRGELTAIAGRVKKNFKRDSGAKVLAKGTPPLTRDSVAAFAEVLRLTFAVELTEAEYDDTVAVFVAYYQSGDPQTRTMLASGWQAILAELKKASGPARDTALQEVRDVLAQRFAAGAQAQIPWAVTMNATIQKRSSTVATMRAPLPEAAKKAELHTQMTEADLDASLEMLYFMWVAAGRDAALVTPETTAQVRMLIVQNFPTFPTEVQLIFANGQKVYSSLRGQWASASVAQRRALARQFATSLDQLGLTVPSRGGDRISAGGAWSDMNGKSHGEWAGEMVQGLAGSSYRSSW